MIDTLRTADVRWLASLDPAFGEGITMRGGILIARIHPNNNRSEGDETVICRALVLMPEGMCRFTIRASWLINEDVPEYAKLYQDLLGAVMRLPVIELPA